MVLYNFNSLTSNLYTLFQIRSAFGGRVVRVGVASL